MPRKKKEKIVVTKGKKKKAVARVRIREGKGIVKINGIPLNVYEPELARLVIAEPLILAKEILGSNYINNLDIDVNVKGGGIMGQAFATRTALGKALVEWSESDELKKRFLEYDRTLLVDDVRMKEPKKYLRKGARARPTTSYR